MILLRTSHRVVVGQVVSDSAAHYYIIVDQRNGSFIPLLLSTAKIVSKEFPCKVNIIFLRGLLFFHPLFFLPQLTHLEPPLAGGLLAFRGGMIAMSSRANEVRLERFNIVLTSIRYRDHGNPLTHRNCKLYQFNFMRTLSRTFIRCSATPDVYLGCWCVFLFRECSYSVMQCNSMIAF